MPSLPSPLNIIGNLGGLTRWLAFSLLGHLAVFGWLATRADTPVARGTTSLQVSLVQGRGNTISDSGQTAPALRGTAAEPPTTKPVPHTVAPSLPPPPEIATQTHSAPNSTPAATSGSAELRSPDPTGKAVASVIAVVSSSVGTETGTAVGSAADADAPAGDAGGAGTVASAGGGGTREEARLARQMRPEYPSGALAKGWEGLVLLRLRVNAKGGVQTVLVEQSSGYDILDRAAYRAARNWLFFPARESGVPVAAEVKVPVVFARERD